VLKITSESQQNAGLPHPEGAQVAAGGNGGAWTAKLWSQTNRLSVCFALRRVKKEIRGNA